MSMNSESGAKPVVAVTGASGLVGSHLVNHLAERGFNVLAVVRSSTASSLFEFYLKSGQVTVKIGDVTDKDSLLAAFKGADVVVHSAGTVDPYGSRKSIFDTNVEGTRNAISAAKSSKVKQFIHISSLSVITGQGDQYDVDESAPLQPCGESYADSKVEAERLVMSSGDANLKVTALRPGFIYGPRERAWMPRVINSIATGKAMLIDGGTKETNVIFVGNLSRAIEAAVLNERAYGQVYNLTDGQGVTKKHLFDSIADGLQLPRVKKKVPGAVARTVCEVVSRIAPMLSVDAQKSLSRYSRAAFRLAGVNQGFSIKKAERDLNYVDRIPFDRAMNATLESFKRERTSGEMKPTIASGRGA